jgi:general secretion pathway protein J
VTRQRGFTLLEVLVAMAIFSILSIVAYGGLSTVLDTRDRLQAQRVYWQVLDGTLQRLEDDLAHARARKVRDLDGTVLPAFLGQPTDTRALGAPSVEFTRGGVIAWGNVARPDMVRVGYRLADGKLARLTWPALDRAPATQPAESPLLEGVEEFKLRFMNATGAWLDAWPAPNSNELLPAGVEVELALKDRGRYKRRFSVHE